MKKIAILLLIFTTYFTQDLTAQVNRDIGRSYAQPKKKKDNIDYLELSSQKLAENLSLDSFQQAVVKDMLKANQTDYERIMALDIPNESKSGKVQELYEKFNTKLSEILNTEQLKKFQEMQEKSKKKKK